MEVVEFKVVVPVAPKPALPKPPQEIEFPVKDIVVKGRTFPIELSRVREPPSEFIVMLRPVISPLMAPVIWRFPPVVDKVGDAVAIRTGPVIVIAPLLVVIFPPTLIEDPAAVRAERAWVVPTLPSREITPDPSLFVRFKE
jgi:hypothetical protein